MFLGKDDKEIDLSQFRTTPDCGFTPIIVSYSFEEINIPEGVSLSNLISFDMTDPKLRVAKSEDLSLIDKALFFKLQATTIEGLTMTTSITVNYF